MMVGPLCNFTCVIVRNLNRNRRERAGAAFFLCAYVRKIQPVR